MPPACESLPVKIFADGAEREGIFDLYRKPFIQGLTTNPTLMKKVGITDYETFAKSLLEVVKDQADLLRGVLAMSLTRCAGRQLKIRDWQENVYVKIPITNTRREIRTAVDQGTRGGRGEAQRDGPVDQLEQVRGSCRPR